MKNKKWINKTSNSLFRAILTLKTLEEAQEFFRDLLTEPEIEEFSRRWQVAQMLDQEIPYSVIEEKTGMSSTTIARISKWLNSGMGGYKNVLDKENKIHHEAG